MKFWNLRGSIVKIICVTSVFAPASSGCKPLIRAVFYPPHVEMHSPAALDRPGETFDHTILQTLLRRYVDTQGLVDYAGFRKDSTQLQSYLDALAAANVKRLSSGEEMALYINAYNAFTIRLILDFSEVTSIRDIPSARRWKDRRWKVGEEVLSLDDIEHEILRRRFRDNRVHFALVCASKGCPPLRNEAFTGAKLINQLDDQARIFFSKPENLRFSSETNTLHLSSITDWYAGDFGGEAELWRYVSRYAAGRVPQSFPVGLEIKFWPYDWSLNKQ